MSHTPYLHLGLVHRLHEMNINKFSAFDSASIRTVSDLISSCPAKTCDLDPVPTRLLKDCSEQLAPAITSMINLSLSTGTLPLFSLLLNSVKKNSLWRTTVQYLTCLSFLNSVKKLSPCSSLTTCSETT